MNFGYIFLSVKVLLVESLDICDNNYISTWWTNSRGAHNNAIHKLTCETHSLLENIEGKHSMSQE